MKVSGPRASEHPSKVIILMDHPDPTPMVGVEDRTLGVLQQVNRSSASFLMAKHMLVKRLVQLFMQKLFLSKIKHKK